MRERFPHVHVISNPANLGYGAANNQALSRARGRFVLLLNPDTRLEPRTLQDLVRFAEKDRGVGVVGCRLLRSDGRLDLACRRSFPTPLVSLYRMVGLARVLPGSRRFGRYNLTYLDPQQTYEVDAVVGALMLVRREVLERVGVFDPSFFLYGEDLDLCLRIKTAGARVVYRGEVVAHHLKRASSRKRPVASCYHFHRAMLLFYEKHFRRRYPVWVTGAVRAAVWTRLVVSVSFETAVEGCRRIPRLFTNSSR